MPTIHRSRVILYGVRILLLVVALLAGTYVSESVLEQWASDGQSRMASAGR